MLTFFVTVSEAGIVLLPQPQHVDGRGGEEGEDNFEFDRGVVKWPKKTVILDTDMFEVEDSWHDTPPEGFSLTVGYPTHSFCIFFSFKRYVQSLIY